MISSRLGQHTCPQCGTSCEEAHHYCPTCGFPVGTVSSADGDRFVGKTLPGGYHILDLVSVGGMGRVYRAEQSVLGRTVAVKIIHPHLLSDDNSALRFMTEARAASQLNHPNSIAVFDFGRTEHGEPYLVMEYLRGKDLARVAHEEGPLPIARIVDVLQQVLAALSEAHALGIIHRDLKPENVMLEPLRRGGDFVKVLDFGLAKLKADTQSPGVTSPGIVCGTPDYMAPEQGRGDPIDGRSDLYSVGVMLYQLLTGRLPFEADNPTQVVMMHLSMPVPDPRQVAPERLIPDDILAALYRALEKEAVDRFQDAVEFSETLGNAVDNLSVGSRMRRSVPPSLAPSDTVRCVSCGSLVPMARFCLECGSRLPMRSLAPGAKTPPQLPLPLAARDEELTFLLERQQQALHGAVGARIVGEAGSGKTRLLIEFLQRCHAAGDHAVMVSPDPQWAEVPYYALRRAIVELTGVSSPLAAVGRVVPVSPAVQSGLADIFEGGIRPEDTRTPLHQRRALADALRWGLELGTLAGDTGRCVLAIDDLQRMDATSRNAFADVIGEPPPLRVLLVATHPPGFESGWSAMHPARLLGPLPTSTAIRLLRIARGTVDLLDEVAEPSPLHVEELVRFALEGGTNPPCGLADLMARRLDTLTPDARRALQALAVLGDETEEARLVRILPPSDAMPQAIASLVARGMVRAINDRLSISHPLLRELVLTGTPVGVRKELHGKALAISEPQEPLEARALHAYFARETFQALLLLERVAERAMARGDAEAEIMALRRGLQLAREEISRGELDDPLRAVLIFGRKLGAALTRAGSYSDAEGVLQEALDIAGPTGLDRARVLGALAHVARGRQRSRDAIHYIDLAIETARQSGAHELVSALTDTRRAWAS